MWIAYFAGRGPPGYVWDAITAKLMTSIPETPVAVGLTTDVVPSPQWMVAMRSEAGAGKLKLPRLAVNFTPPRSWIVTPL